MPFTFSHPAAILPFKNLSHKWVSLTALALGSMAPDFEFFFRLKSDTDISHTFEGLFLFDIPVVLGLAFLYHNKVRTPLIDHLPAFLYQRFVVYQRFNWNEYFKHNKLVVLISATIGTLTHFFCDALTHKRGWFVQQIPELSSTISLWDSSYPFYFFLQYFSSFILGVILIVQAFLLPKTNIAKVRSYFWMYWALVAFTTVVVIVLRFWPSLNGIVFNDFIMTVITGGLLGILLSSIMFVTRKS